MHALSSCRTAKTGDLQHQPLSKRVEFLVPTPQEEKLCLKKKTQTKGKKNQSPQKKNGIPFWKMPKDFPTFPTESAAANTPNPPAPTGDMELVAHENQAGIFIQTPAPQTTKAICYGLKKYTGVLLSMLASDSFGFHTYILYIYIIYRYISSVAFSILKVRDPLKNNLFLSFSKGKKDPFP